MGLFLQKHLNKKTTIVCTGAALAFLSGQQIRIPKWADKYYLGWLIRCMSDPLIFVPRYLSLSVFSGFCFGMGKSLQLKHELGSKKDFEK